MTQFLAGLFMKLLLRRCIEHVTSLVDSRRAVEYAAEFSTRLVSTPACASQRILMNNPARAADVGGVDVHSKPADQVHLGTKRKCLLFDQDADDALSGQTVTSTGSPTVRKDRDRLKGRLRKRRMASIWLSGTSSALPNPETDRARKVQNAKVSGVLVVTNR